MMERLRRGRKPIVALLVVVAIAAVARVRARERAGEVITRVEERALDAVVPFTGRVRALQVAQYGPPPLTQVWEYRITELAREGSEVAAGDVLIRFDTTELEQIDEATHVPQGPEYWRKVMPGPDRWGVAPPPSNRMKAAMSGALYLGDEQSGDARCEDIIGRRLG